MIRRLYYGSVGPILFDDEGFIADPSDMFVNMNRVGLATDSYILAAGFGYLDTDGSHFLTIRWNEAGGANRILSFVLGDGNRTLTLNENFTIGDGNAGTLTFSAASKTLVIDESETISNYHTDARAATWLAANHENTYNHTNYDTAFGWGDHAGLYDPAGTMTTHEAAADPHTGYAKESVVGTSVGTSLLLDGAVLKASSVLQTYHGINPSANVQTMLGSVDNAAILSNIGAAVASHAMSTHSNEDTYNIATSGSILSSGTGGVTTGSASNLGKIVIYDGSDHKITITSPAIAGDWQLTLPPNDGDAGNILTTDGNGICTWTSAGAGDVTAAAALTNNLIVRGDTAAKAVQTSGITLDDSNNLSGIGTVGCGTITTTGNVVLPANGVIGVTDGNPQIVFDNVNNWLEITGDVGIGTMIPTSPNGIARFLSISDAAHVSLVLDETAVNAWEIYINAGSFHISDETDIRLIIGAGGNVDIRVHDGGSAGLRLGGTLVTATATELNLLNGATLKQKVIDIGDWNMYQSNGGTNHVSIAHGLAHGNIRSITVLIRRDSAQGGLPKHPLDYSSTDGKFNVGTTNVELYGMASGTFDTNYYDETSYNRGWITIWYVP